ncbi:hypothetical protein, partial [Pseudomonas paralcaligenes]|uniref:hypothetical protein n=1 Tax=Pseudomonas paralcaligenes TaxID=2772558 RepID=UPI0021D27F33
SKPKQQLANGGRVRGPGTGTSDDIEAQVPAGSYIMPADSTEQIGEGALAALGQGPVDVNVSNGEYGLPPEQVHAVGVQALDAMKNATHTPTGQPALGFRPRGDQQQDGEPELFFADGGVVKDDLKKRLQQQTAALAANRQTQRAAGFGPTAGVASPGYSANPATAAAQAAADSAAQRVATQTGNNPARAARMQAQMNQPVTRGGQPLPTQQNAAGFSAARFAPFPLAAPLAEGSDTRAVVSGTVEDVGDEFSQGNYARGFGKAVRGALSVAPAVVADNARAAGSSVAPLAEAARGFGGAVLGVEESPAAAAAPRSAGAPRPAAAAAATPGAASSAPEQDAARGWTRTGNGVAVRTGANGVQEFSNDPEALAGARGMPSGGVGRVGDGRGTFSQLEPGTSKLALERFERANQERARMIEESRRGQLGEGGGRLTIVRDSTRAPSRADVQNAQLDARLAQTEAQRQATQQAGADADLRRASETQRMGTEQLTQQRMQQQIAEGDLSVQDRQRLDQLRGQINDQSLSAQERAAALEAYNNLAVTPDARLRVQQEGVSQQQKLIGDLYKAFSTMQTPPVVGEGDSARPMTFEEWLQPALRSIQGGQPARNSVSRAEVEQTASARGISSDEVIRRLKSIGVTVTG